MMSTAATPPFRVKAVLSLGAFSSSETSRGQQLLDVFRQQIDFQVQRLANAGGVKVGVLPSVGGVLPSVGGDPRNGNWDFFEVLLWFRSLAEIEEKIHGRRTWGSRGDDSTHQTKTIEGHGMFRDDVNLDRESGVCVNSPPTNDKPIETVSGPPSRRLAATPQPLHIQREN